MQKTVFIIERQDNHGEFQPQNMSNLSTRGKAVTILDTIKMADPAGKFRIVEYVRKVNRS